MTRLVFPLIQLAALLLIPNISQSQTPDYVGSNVCITCHQDIAQQWQGSHHALAWTEVGPDTVIADFDGTTFAHDGMSVRFRQTDGGYSASVTEKDGVTTDYDVHSVVGIEPLHQYLFETAPGTLQSFDVVWDTEKGEWFHLYPDQDLPPDDGLHWTGPYKNWNARCAECHATGYRRNYNPRSQSYASTQAEIGVGCEACHGPGSAHLDWTEDRPISPELSPYGFTMEFGKGDTESEIQQCATCHSRREALGDGNPIPGRMYHDDYTLALLRSGAYHADGQILDEVYVYGSFLQSKMYANGVGCMNCHEPHGAGLVAEGNAVCAQCHSPAGNPDFPSLRLVEYDTPDHHKHPEGSVGAQCVSCHMIERVYMGNDGRRDHSFRVPRPDLGAITGSPDACTDCHDDQTQEWAAEQIETWYPTSDHRGPHYGEVFAVARQTPGPVSGSLGEIALNPDQPGIVRATALYLLQGAATPEIADDMATLLTDDDPLVRASAADLQRALPHDARAERLKGAMTDPMASVRIAAAKPMLDVPPQALTPSQRAALQQAMRDWQRSLGSRLDFPETHLVMGGMALTMRNAEAAERAFAQVVQMDPQRAEAWPMLVRLTQITRGDAAARSVLREGLQKVPDHPELLRLLQDLGR